ncbi:glutamate--tRNA ligase [Hyphococcus sp.]|uniref:glutamate--tRNA ligase n=1 Tax=Hyphococcus sp. TaxID=2038636 RepID=UPI00208BAE0C|nr:MAG: glutamate--tRNA ligase 1 [Marinicaulis sp.]
MNSQNADIVTRFAPSPTGYLHIGGARTALFNWLFARGRGGKFLLRIEDTDRARHTEAAVGAIIDGLRWLGLDWDGDPVSQFERSARHAEVAHELLATGKAYRCYMTAEETNAARDKAREQGVRFESPWREADPKSAPNAPFAIRFKAPRDGETIVEDAVQGRVKFPNAALDDLIILRSDGGPTYNLAVVVDDHDMAVTHVIRGDDHLNNAARQSQIYQAMGWGVPVFAHVPLIHGQDGAKLSKRHGALGVEAYRDLGYLPEGLANYLLRLGWAHGDEEIIPYERAKQLFDLKGINKAPARLDLDKLSHVNAQYIAALSDDEFVQWTAPFLLDAGVSLDTDGAARLLRSAPFLKPRCTTLADAVAATEYLFLQRPLAITGKAAKPLDKDGARAILGELLETLDGTEIWASAAALDAALQSFVSEKNIGFGVIGPPARAALTAGRPSPGLGEVLYGLGRDESSARLADQLR